ncbi:MAG: hypothetical protein ACUVS2_12580 [Candidatus Flexifilum sp.]|jgi:hypothetical protein
MDGNSDITGSVIRVVQFDQMPLYQIARQIAEVGRKVNMLRLKYSALISEEDLDGFRILMIRYIWLGQFQEDELPLNLN